jgi:hypothetical protein
VLQEIRELSISGTVWGAQACIPGVLGESGVIRCAFNGD